MPTICLNMIVKNEAHVIGRCLAAVKPLIDYWVIVDTGSSDGTQDAIRTILQDIPGELHERPWKNFGHNRSEALVLARGKADYIFINDADEVVEAPPGFRWPALDADAYYLHVRHGDIDFARLALVSARLPWRYEGVLHEYLVCDAPHRTDTLSAPTVRVHSDGARSQMDVKQKYANDAAVLEQALREEPDNARYVFYLAQSYRDAEQWQQALTVYQQRAAMGGWAEEVWYSLYEIALLSERLQLSSAVVLERYLQAFQYRPRRVEPLVELARLYRNQGQYALAHLFAARALEIPLPDDLLFIDAAAYQWRRFDEYAIAAYWIGDYAAAERVNRQLLALDCLPAAQRTRIADNLDWSLRQQLSAAASTETPALPRPASRDTHLRLHPQSEAETAVTCPVCTASAHQRHAATPYWVCPQCDAWFQQPLPPKLYHAADEPPPAAMSEADRAANRALARLLFNNVMGGQPGAIFDIGARLPVLAAELQRLGCTAMAMDGFPGAEPLGKLLEVPVIGADFETWDSRDHAHRFRLITLIHTFEHFYDPAAALRKLHGLLAADGTLFIRLPDHRVAGYERDLTPGHYSIHPFFHSLTSIEHLLAQVGGFATVETYPLPPGQRDFILRRATAAPTAAPAPRPVIALHRPGAIGDILMTLNLIPLLRARHPHHAIHYFCHPRYAAADALGGLLHAAGVDAIFDSAQFAAAAPHCVHAYNLIGYPLAEGYPQQPMRRHLIEYFAAEMALPITDLPALVLPLPPRPADAPPGRYATLQTRAGWSKYKEWPHARWQAVQDALDMPLVLLGEDQGRSLAHSVALLAHADLHLGIDSFANHLTHYLWQAGDGSQRRVPGVILFGSTQASASGYPHNTNLTTALPCQPCFRENPAFSRQDRGPCINPPRPQYADDLPPACMDGLTVAQVLTAIAARWAQ